VSKLSPPVSKLMDRDPLCQKPLIIDLFLWSYSRIS